MSLRDINLAELDRNISYEERIRYRALPRAVVLALPDFEKLRYFCAARVWHQKLADAVSQMCKTYMNISDKYIMSIIGPSGSGKSAFCNEDIRSLFKATTYGAIPYLYVDALAYGNKLGEFPDVMPQILRAAGEVAIADKFTTVTKDGKLLVTSKALKLARQHVRIMCRERGVKVLVLDEIIHVLRNVRGGDFNPHDAIKSLSLDLAGGMLCLVGGPELYKMLRYGQILRRGEFIYLGRYTQAEEDAARAAIRAANRQDSVFPPVEGYVRKLKGVWPCEEVPPFENIIPQIILGTVGLPGPIKTVMAQCLIEQLLNHGKWDPSFFVRSTLSAAAILALREEVETGEKMMQDDGWTSSIFSEAEQMDIENALTITPSAHGQKPANSPERGGTGRNRDAKS